MRRILVLALCVASSACFHVGKKRSLLDVPYSALLIAGMVAGSATNSQMAGGGTNPQMQADSVTRVRGHVTLGGILGDAIRFEKLELVRNGRIRMTTSSGANGEFEFSGELPDGRYEIRLASDRYQGERPVTIDGFGIEELEVIGEPL